MLHPDWRGTALNPDRKQISVLPFLNAVSQQGAEKRFCRYDERAIYQSPDSVAHSRKQNADSRVVDSYTCRCDNYFGFLQPVNDAAASFLSSCFFDFFGHGFNGSMRNLIREKTVKLNIEWLYMYLYKYLLLLIIHRIEILGCLLAIQQPFVLIGGFWSQVSRSGYGE